MKHGVLFFVFLSFASLSVAETLEFTFSDFPPFEYTEFGSVAGINKEIVEEACRRLGVTPVFTQLPWKRALKYAKEGRVDAVFSLFKNEERVKYFNFPQENLNTVKMVLLTNRESDVEVTCLEDMRGKKVGIYLGSSYGETFDAADQIIKDPASTNELLLRKQARGRTDLIIIDERVARYWSKKIGMENRFKILSFTVTEERTYVAFSKAKANKNKKNMADRFSEVFKEMKNDGFIENIYNNYKF